MLINPLITTNLTMRLLVVIPVIDISPLGEAALPGIAGGSSQDRTDI
jgi:hypothetical protein